MVFHADVQKLQSPHKGSFFRQQYTKTMVCPTDFTHADPALTFNGEIGSLMLSLEAQRGRKSYNNPNSPMV
jgi:hypothetical protein